MQFTNTTGAFSGAERVPDMVEMKDPVSEKNHYD
jgi:hypothetical protein